MEKFDVIVVGAGLAGLAAAYTLAGEGVEVVVLERGDYPGSKNVSGGRLYLNPVRDLFPGLWDGAPLERAIVREGATLMARNRSFTFHYTGSELRADTPQSYSVLRSKFDRWFSERVEERGGMILTKTLVTDVIRENGKIAGVIAGGDELRADVVIACDGVLSLIPEKAGLRAPGRAHDNAVGVKELIQLDPAVINDRFQVDDGEGAAHLFVGDITKGLFGGGFLYTNRDSVSLGLVAAIEDMAKEEAAGDVPALFESFKARPEIEPLIRGGKTVEYGAHVIPEGGYRASEPPLWGRHPRGRGLGGIRPESGIYRSRHGIRHGIRSLRSEGRHRGQKRRGASMRQPCPSIRSSWRTASSCKISRRSRKHPGCSRTRISSAITRSSWGICCAISMTSPPGPRSRSSRRCAGI